MRRAAYVPTQSMDQREIDIVKETPEEAMMIKNEVRDDNMTRSLT